MRAEAWGLVGATARLQRGMAHFSSNCSGDCLLVRPKRRRKEGKKKRKKRGKKRETGKEREREKKKVKEILKREKTEGSGRRGWSMKEMVVRLF